jgi:putative hemolysin
MSNPTAEVVIIAVLIVLNGVFSAGEIAIVSSRKSKIKELIREKKDRRAETLLGMKENPERFLSAVQVGITLFGTLASALGGIISVKYVSPLFGGLFPRDLSETISLIIVVAVLTYLSLVVGELVPKYIGMNYKEAVALRIVPIIELTSKLFFFLVNFLTLSTMAIVKGLGLKKGEDHVGEGEIKILLEEGRRKGVFDQTEEELIHGVFKFADRLVKEIMVPRPNIYAIDIGQTKDEILKYIIENEYSRYPVYKDHSDNIIGVVYHKDITRHIWLKEPFDLEKLLKKPFFVPETMELTVLLKEMQRRHSHMAVAADEYGSTVGIVTLEDIMEEIFGEIMDETDVDDRMERMKDGSVIIDAAYSIRDLNGKMEIDLPEGPDYETLGGFILSQLQGIAKGGEVVYVGAYKFTVVDVEGRRITKVRIERARSGPKKALESINPPPT